MKVLTLRQPWAWLAVSGFKDIENRSWATDFRGPLLIHAGKAKPHRDDLEWAAERLAAAWGVHLPDVFTLGALVGRVHVIDCVQTSRSVWHVPGSFGFVLSNAVAFENPVPLKGRLGLFRLGDALHQ
jgi:hypothetical protein